MRRSLCYARSPARAREGHPRLFDGRRDDQQDRRAQERVTAHEDTKDHEWAPKSPRVPYLAVADALRQRLDSGEWLPGAALPSITELGRLTGVPFDGGPCCQGAG